MNYILTLFYSISRTFTFIQFSIVKMATVPNKILPKDVKQHNLQAYLKQEGFVNWESVKTMTYVRIVRASESQLDDELKNRGFEKEGLLRSDYIAAIKQLPKWIENHPSQSGGMCLVFLFFYFFFLVYKTMRKILFVFEMRLK